MKKSLVVSIVTGLFMMTSTITAGISYAMSQGDEDLLRKIDGRRYVGFVDVNYTPVIDVRSKVLVKGVIARNTGYYESPDPDGSRFEITGREFTVGCNIVVYGNVRCVERTYTISEDGDKIIEHTRLSDGSVRQQIWLWQR